MGYSIADFLQSLEIGDCKIHNTPKAIFLCGGKIEQTGPYKSARDFFYRYFCAHHKPLAQRVRLAETVNAWFDREIFPDLLELETYLADLADLTLLFVESPGSIAELGAFSASPVLGPKTVAVINNFYELRRTFIADGPLAKLKNHDVALVQYFDWDPHHLNTAATKREFRAIARALVAILRSRGRRAPDLLAFDREKHGHVLLLIADLARLAGVISHADIASLLRTIAVDSSGGQVDRYISLLENLGFVTLKRYSTQDFFLGATEHSFVRYAYKPDAPFRDQVRITSALRASLEKPRKRLLARAVATRSGGRRG